nr:ADP-ribosylglycohydrolase family protein [Armatimonadota bacterium]
IQYYVHEQLHAPLVVTDDDISGTFTFLRALSDNGCRKDITAEAIGRTWLNYLIQDRTVLWWGGMGRSTEHTAYLRLKGGIPAPRSGSIQLNGRTVAEQIGAQIFIDGWGMVAPGDPALAADLARRAASVSHDGEAIYGAQVIAAMEAAAFEEGDLGRLLDIATGFVPKDSLIFRMIDDLRGWRRSEDDWRKTREKLAERYGYQHYGGGCHMIPNHGVIILALLYGEDDFGKSLAIANTAGWDTDCNSGNVGCLMALKNGLAGLETGPDWRGPVADRMYLPTADGGRAITDALSEAYSVARIGRALAGEHPLPYPKDGARFHFSLPGSVQGFRVEDSSESRGVAVLSNSPTPEGHGMAGGAGALRISYSKVAPGRPCRVSTATFVTPEMRLMGGYGMVASPTLYPGQRVRARLVASPENGAPIQGSLYLRFYGAEDASTVWRSPVQELAPGAALDLEWPIEETGGSPIYEIGVELTSSRRTDGVVWLDHLSWDGVPNVTFQKSLTGSGMWLQAWVPGVTRLERAHDGHSFVVIQDEGIGIASQGTREWKDYEVKARITPRIGGRVGLAARVQGQRRYLALVLAPGYLQLLESVDKIQVLAEQPFQWETGSSFDMSIRVEGTSVTAEIAGGPTLKAAFNAILADGAVGFYCEEGRLDSGPVSVRPLDGANHE